MLNGCKSTHARRNFVLSDTENRREEIPNEEVLDIAGAARFLKCGTSTLYHYVCQKKIPCFKLGARTLFKRTDLLDWLDRYRREPENGFPSKAVNS